MSRAEVERFVNDLSNDANLLENVRPSATGLGSLVASGNSRGYTFTLDEAKDHLRSIGVQTATTKPFDTLASDTATSTVQSAEVVTSVVEAAEVTTTTVQDVEAATTVTAVAEAVVVLV
ncbi:Nif11-like leader peptide family natural product precursor [Bradyrhizobium sp. CCGUVB1N3]|uniref:Nif11-like leader peptide family natural product precursor n=1 Tax=Bradyrhizobium sp. CCGUVB1N3 TaxID=2949629 RepID=UPI0020B2CE40|nr:Nif11-like leader peptide family natural product precursor [Bradyrhizobium sp. CCGUVB1N3]MCP3476551.1 Nif11-like leader peptide family natural product precursor [Bradyrhizobium sp. CCGUVB1N3]